MLAYLLPVPFLAAMLAALLMPRRSGGNAPRWLGYAGAVAGVVTLIMLATLWDGTLVGSSGGSSGGSQAAGAATAGNAVLGSAGARVTWLSIGDISVPWTVMTDNLSLLLVAIVSGIGVLIFSYSVGYLEPSEDLRRYYAVLALFAASMIAVVTSGNLIQLFFAWELVGVSSYLLIGFWHTKESAVAAARKAFLTIIVGDAFLLSGILLLWHVYGTFDIVTILGAAHASPLTIAAGLCIIVGAMSKSAQFPLHAWLPDAMEGPTPVSAFLHSATMVKAGLFLIIRMLPLIVIAGLSPVLVVIATITIVLSALCALVQTDIKRVLAYSTMNQLGFILLAVGVGATTAGLFHLLNHSVFKALLFLCAGAIIHLAGTQDITRMNIKLGNNVLAICTGIGALALAGFPVFSGFFSKDAIFEAVLHSHSTGLAILFVLAVLLSSLYIFRWYFLIFRTAGFIAHLPWEMRAPLPLLAIGCVVGGLFMLPFYARFGTSPPHLEITTILVATLSTLLAALGLFTAYLIYQRGTWSALATRASGTPLALAAQRRFLVDDAQAGLASGVAAAAAIIGRVDGGINHGLDMCARGVRTAAQPLRRLIDGSPSAYVAGIIIGFIIIALFLRFA